MQTIRHKDAFVLVMGGLLAFAWLVLWLWAGSPFGRYLDHGDWTKIGLAGALCAAIPAGDAVVPAALYVGGWLFMIAAMMLPTTLPLLAVYHRLTQRRADRSLLLGLVIAGYLSAWTGFGLAAHAADLALHRIVLALPWLTFHGWVIGAAVIAIAGLFQFSPLKHRCLEKCRTTLSFVIAHWQGRHERRQAFRMGWRHGVFCVGCCWALMLLMFVVGTGSVGWMLLLGAVMAVEKNMPWGRRLTAPLGIALIAGSLALAAWHLGQQAAVAG